MTERWLGKSWQVFLFYLLFSLVWSWPLVLSPASSLLSLHFDQFPAAWLVHAAPSFRDGVSELSAWPAGEPLVRLDSFLFLLLAMGLQGLVPGLLLTNLFVLFGPPLSAVAAEKLAREMMGAKAPASLLTGFAFGFAPLATVALLEGHVYYLLNPWLPLFVLHLWRDTKQDDLKAGGYFLLCLLTTAYMGVNAALLTAILLGLRLYQGGRRIPFGFLAVAGIGGLAYSLLFLGGGGHQARENSDALVRLGSASLTTLVAWNPWMDLNRHSLAPAFGIAPLCLALLSPFAGIRNYRIWLATGLLCLLLSVGPLLEIGVARQEAWPTPLYPLLSLGIFDTFRFPIRFAWTGSLAFGLLSAAFAQKVRWPWILVGFLMIDTTLISGGSFRLRRHPAPIPGIYQNLPAGPLLDLYPEIGGLQEDMSFYQQNLSCYYQLGHQHPILDRCLNTDLSQNPRFAAAGEVHHRILDSEGSVREYLKELKVTSVVLHRDLYQPDERAQVEAGLTNALGPPIAESREGGEWLAAWKVE